MARDRIVRSLAAAVASAASATLRDAPAGLAAAARAGAIVPAVLVFVYGFNLWTFFLSFTNSKAFTSTNLIGLANYQKLWNWTFETDPPSSWYTALVNMGIFGGLYVVFCLSSAWRWRSCSIRRSAAKASCGRSISIRWRSRSSSPARRGSCSSIRASGSKRRCTTGAGRASISIGSSIRSMMIYCVAIAGIWQTSGFVMAMFLAGLRGVDGEILKAAQIDGASAFQTYRRIIIPIIRPVFFSALIVLTHMAIKSYDLVLSVTGKNPGGAAELPSTFMYSYTFTRNQMAVGSTSAVIMLMTIAAIMVPYLYSELKEKAR